MSSLIGKLISLSPTSVYTTDVTHQKLDFVTDGLLEELGYEYEEMVEISKSQYQDIIHPEDKDGLLAFIKSVREQKPNDHNEINIRFRSKGGKYHWYHVYNMGYEFDEEGKPLKTCGWTLNIDYQKQLEKELRKTIDDFEQLKTDQNAEMIRVLHKAFEVFSKLASSQASSGYQKELFEYLERFHKRVKLKLP